MNATTNAQLIQNLQTSAEQPQATNASQTTNETNSPTNSPPANKRPARTNRKPRNKPVKKNKNEQPEKTDQNEQKETSDQTDNVETEQPEKAEKPIRKNKPYKNHKPNKAKFNKKSAEKPEDKICLQGVVCENLTCTLKHPPERLDFLMKLREKPAVKTVPSPKSDPKQVTKPAPKQCPRQSSKPVSKPVADPSIPSNALCFYDEKCTNIQCTFIHSDQEARNVRLTCLHDTKCTKPKCKRLHSDQATRHKRFYCSYGINCNKGASCEYIHDSKSAPQKSFPNPNKNLTPKPPKACRFANCTKPNCTYFHAPRNVEGIQLVPPHLRKNNNGIDKSLFLSKDAGRKIDWVDLV